MKSSRHTLLFDLGGILADLGDPVTAMELDLEPDEFWGVWLGSPLVRAYETGELELPEFCRQIAVELGQPCNRDFEARFRKWQLRLFPGVEEFVQSLAGQYRLALLSNTNEVHWGQVNSSTRMFSRFDKTFLSFETGHFKPSLASYQQVVSYFECNPNEVIFVDDSLDNVLAANSIGMNAYQVKGIEDVKLVLNEV